MPQIGNLNAFVAGTPINPVSVNANFDAIKTVVNTNALLTDVARTIVVTNIWGAPQNFDAGSVAAPSIFFGGEVGLGFYRPAAGELAVTVGGVKVATFHAGGLRMAPGKSITYE